MSEETPASLSPEAAITTGRVELSSSDVDVLVVWATDNDEVSGFCTWGIQALRDQAIACMNNEAIPHPWSQLIFIEDTVIGLIFVTQNSGNYDKCRAEVGYCLEKKYFRKGIVKSVLKVMIPTIFQEWPDLERLEANVEVNDWASRSTLEGAGLHREGVLRKYRILEGRAVDVAKYRFLSSDLQVGLSLD